MPPSAHALVHSTKLDQHLQYSHKIDCKRGACLEHVVVNPTYTIRISNELTYHTNPGVPWGKTTFPTFHKMKSRINSLIS